MTRSISTALSAAVTLGLFAASAVMLGAVAEAKAFPSENNHATPEMVTSFPALF